jgi:hypothetical protein
MSFQIFHLSFGKRDLWTLDFVFSLWFSVPAFATVDPQFGRGNQADND